jgi:hypothetical protein
MWHNRSMGGQTNLDANNNDVPDAWEPYSLEGAAEAMETIPDNTNWQLDWGSPGKQHQTDQIYND